MMAWLLVAAAFGGFALLGLFRASTMPLFFLDVCATEFGHFFGVVSLALAAFAPKSSISGVLATAVLGFAGVLLLAPLARALWFAHRRGVRVDFARLWVPAAAHRPEGVRLESEGSPGRRVNYDFYRADGPTPAPLVVIVHGGGWMAGSARELSGWNDWLVEQGHAVAAVDYRLMPTGAWPAQRDDVLAVVDHLRARAAEHHIDPSRIVLLGRSAGGQIASAIVAKGGMPWLRGCICLYAPFDLFFGYEHGSDDDMLRSRWLIRCFLGGRPDEREHACREASAWHSILPGAPPFLLMHGSRDELVWVAQSRRFAKKLAELGIDHTFVELPWATHAFDFNMNGPGGQIAAASFGKFLRKVCA